MTGYGATLPGFEQAAAPDGPLTIAARETIAALEAQGLIEPRHKLTTTIVMSLARAVDAGLAAPKVSVATATLSKHLLEAVESLPTPEATSSDAWANLEKALAEASA